MRNLFYLIKVCFVTLVFLAGCSSTPEVVEEAPPQEAAPEPVVQQQEPVEPEPAPEPEIALDTIFYFDYDDATVQPSAREIIQAHAERLMSNAESIRIEGYADERGTEAYNRELGQRRAEAVRDILVSMGVDSGQIETVSYGESNPLVVGSGESAWQQNRRVELK
ncbi:MAG: OmpA family protein [Gammaproteobacteria bacterium]|jgi:peptidoglycan-associated lipoprotein